MRRLEIAGAAHLVLAENVHHLDAQEAVLNAMREGWVHQQLSRMLSRQTIEGRLGLIARFSASADSYPWEWKPSDLEDFTADLRSGANPIAHSTARQYQNTIAQFCEYITDPRYDWTEVCRDRFDAVPIQICHEWNTVHHTADFEGQPGRRALTYDEIQSLFDAADLRIELAKQSGRKGVLSAIRDAAMLKTVYAFGLRRNEACKLDLADLRRNPRVSDYGRFGAVEVRWGKASGGSPPKRRTVLLAPEFDWILDVLRPWLEDARPAFSPGNLGALWVTERASRVSVRLLDKAFVETKVLAGLPDELDLHSLRHSYVTHLLEFGYPELFVQQQVGHSYAATTAIYSSVSDEYRNRLLTGALNRQIERNLGPISGQELK